MISIKQILRIFLTIFLVKKVKCKFCYLPLQKVKPILHTFNYQASRLKRRWVYKQTKLSLTRFPPARDAAAAAASTRGEGGRCAASYGF